jgi:hypothetical protein
MDATKIKLKMLRSIMEADEAHLEAKVKEAYTEFCSECNTDGSNCASDAKANRVVAYSRDGLPLSFDALKKEILSITEDANKGLPVHHRLNGILWL